MGSSGDGVGSRIGTPSQPHERGGPLIGEMAFGSCSLRVQTKWRKGFRITPLDSIADCLTESARHFNCDAEDSRRKCCQWHFALSVYDRILKQKMAGQCNQ